MAAPLYAGAMNLLLLAAPILSFVLLGAHFMREGAWILVAVCIAFALLLAWRTRWAVRLVQAALVLGAVEWIWTALILVQERMAEGRPWIRLAAILGGVALFTLGSAVLLTRRKLGPGPSPQLRRPG